MGTSGENQHYISQFFQQRFSGDDGKFRKYFIKTSSWKNNAVPSNTFSSEGHTNMLADGVPENSLERLFERVENNMPDTFAALDAASKKPFSVLSDDLYTNLCWYCAFLHTLSPFFKAKAPVDFLHDLHVQLINGKGDLLDQYLAMHPIERSRYKNAIINGKKIVFEAENYHQLLHRIQFKRLCREYFNQFRFLTKWSVCNSPVNLPLSDIALIEFGFSPEKIVYSLPIAPKLLLLGLWEGQNKLSVQTTIVGNTFSLKRAENWVDVICLSAQVAFISREKINHVPERRKRALDAGHFFNRVKSPEKIIASGTKDFKSDFSFKIVSEEEFKIFVGQFI